MRRKSANLARLLNIMADNILKIVGEIPPGERPQYVIDFLDDVKNFKVSYCIRVVITEMT